MKILGSKSLVFLSLGVGPKADPSEPSLVAFGITFPSDETEDIEHIKALVKQCVIDI
jgi:hypothetical protein